MDNKYSYLFSIPEHTEMPSDAYLFDPICKLYIYNRSVDTDRLFICDNHIQRLIFYSGHPWEDWEQDHIDKFK